MTPKSRKQGKRTDSAPPPARMMTSNAALLVLGVAFVVIGAFAALDRQWIEAAIFLGLGAVMAASVTPFFGQSRTRSAIGLAVTVVALGLFAWLVVGDFAG
jgi:hypothetical protein